MKIRVYNVCLRIPAHWLLYNEMYMKYSMTDIEFVAPEINFGQVPQSLFDKERAAVWTAGIILYRFLIGVSPWTLEKAVHYGKSSGRDGLPLAKKLVVLMRDHEPDYSKFTNLEFVNLFKSIFVIQHTGRISLAQFRDSLGNILNGYRVRPVGGLSKTAPVGNPSPRGQPQNPGMFTSYTPGMANPPPRNPSPRRQPQNPGMFTSYTPGMAQPNQQPISGNNFAPQGGMAQSFAPQGGMAQSFVPGGQQHVSGNNFAPQGGMMHSFTPGMGAQNLPTRLMGGQNQPTHLMGNSFMPGGENLNLSGGNSFNPDGALSRNVSHDERQPAQQQNFIPEPIADKTPNHLGFQPEGGSLSQMRQRATIYENFQAAPSGKKPEYNPLEDLFNDRPIQAQPTPIIEVQESNLSSQTPNPTNWVQMEKTESNMMSMTDWENKEVQFQKLRAESEQISQLASSNFLAKPEDLDDFFSDTHSENYEFDLEDIDEGPRAKSTMGDRKIDFEAKGENLAVTYGRIETIEEGRGKGDRVGDGNALTNFAAALGLAGGKADAPNVLKDIVKPAEVIIFISAGKIKKYCRTKKFSLRAM